MHRRSLVQTTATLGLGALAHCALPGVAQPGVKTPFAVPVTTVPIVGSDLQRALGDEKKPWEIGKSFDHSAPIGPLHLASQTGPFKHGGIWLKVNGVQKQNANLNQRIWSVAEQIARLSEAFELMPGDIIYSGTPENVGPLVRGDVIDCHIDGLPNLGVKIV